MQGDTDTEPRPGALAQPQGRAAAFVLRLCVVLAASLGQVAQAQEIQLRPGQLLYAGAAPISLGAYAIPCVADWNGDGRKDLIVGYLYRLELAQLAAVACS
jgi:hypothetical protein